MLFFHKSLIIDELVLHSYHKCVILKFLSSTRLSRADFLNEADRRVLFQLYFNPLSIAWQEVLMHLPFTGFRNPDTHSISLVLLKNPRRIIPGWNSHHFHSFSREFINDLDNRTGIPFN